MCGEGLWRRGERGGTMAAWTPGAGRRGLSPEGAEEVVWRLHGLVMNGGIDHALGVGLDPEVPLPDILGAFRLLGLQDLAALVEEVAADEDADERATDAWSDIVPSDGDLQARIDAGRR